MPYTSVGFDTIEAVKVLQKNSIRQFLSHCERIHTNDDDFLYRDKATHTLYSKVVGNAVKIQTSIPYFLKGHNIELSGYKDIAKFLELIEGRFNQSFETAQITRLDITATIETENPFTNYFSVFTNPRYFGAPCIFDTSFYINSKNVVIHCYDKSIQDCKNLQYVRKQCSDTLHPNLSRLEVRLVRKVCQTLRKKGEWSFQQMQLNDLTKKEHFFSVLRYAQRVMNSIIITPKLSSIRSKKGFAEWYLLKQLATDPSVAHEIEEMFNNGGMTKVVYDSLQKDIQNATNVGKRIEIQSLLKTAFDRTYTPKGTRTATKSYKPTPTGILVKIPPKLYIPQNIPVHY